jgi:hypothetical protein
MHLVHVVRNSFIDSWNWVLSKKEDRTVKDSEEIFLKLVGFGRHGRKFGLECYLQKRDRGDEPMKKMSVDELVRKEWVEHQMKVLDLASFLDRVDRLTEDHGELDFRIEAFQEAIAQLVSGGLGRVNRVQALLSDRSIQIVEAPEVSQGRRLR